MTTTYYTLLQTEFGQAIQCGRCRLISYHPDDLSNRYCGFCKLFLGDLSGPLLPLTLAEFQIIYQRLYRFLTAEEAIRQVVFPAGTPRRMEKLTVVQQALRDLTHIKDVLKQQFQITLPAEQAAPIQTPLLDIGNPPNSKTY